MKRQVPKGLVFLHIYSCQCPPLLAMASIWRPARHELCPCYVRPIAAAIDETSLRSVLWESSGLKALL